MENIHTHTHTERDRERERDRDRETERQRERGHVLKRMAKGPLEGAGGTLH